jgi:hypothetical protein
LPPPSCSTTDHSADHEPTSFQPTSIGSTEARSVDSITA